jgi:alanine-alpha-ketoisovalerate/valine-pyruvate aminotransferase
MAAAKKSKAEKLVRGSEKLMAKGQVFSEKEIKQFHRIAARSGVKLVDWSIYGQPGPDVIFGKYQVDPKSAARLVRDLINLRGVRVGIEIFPLGIPVPEVVIVDFDTRFGGMR